MLKNAPAPVPAEEIVTEKNTAEPLANTETKTAEETPQEEIATEKMLAQVSESSGPNPFMNSIILGAALFFGLIFGSVIIARSLRKN